MAGSVPEGLKYTKEHEWARQRQAVVVVGITDHAQRQLGDIVYVELPKVGDRFEANEPFGTVESVKAVTEIYAPSAVRSSRSTRACPSLRKTSTMTPMGKGG